MLFKALMPPCAKSSTIRGIANFADVPKLSSCNGCCCVAVSLGTTDQSDCDGALVDIALSDDALVSSSLSGTTLQSPIWFNPISCASFTNRNSHNFSGFTVFYCNCCI